MVSVPKERSTNGRVIRPKQAGKGRQPLSAEALARASAEGAPTRRQKAAPKKAKPRSKRAKNVSDHQSKRLQKMNLYNGQALLNKNIFDAVKNNDGTSEAPRFTSCTKSEALKELEKEFQEAPAELKNDYDRLDAALKAFTGGRHSISRTPTGEWHIAGMHSYLTNYQVQGVGGMRALETSGTLTRGGILADAMGFGSKALSMRLPFTSLTMKRNRNDDSEYCQWTKTQGQGNSSRSYTRCRSQLSCDSMGKGDQEACDGVRHQ